MGALLLIAGFFVTRIGLYLNRSIDVANNLNGQQVLSAQDEDPFLKDTDGDGISDVDESYYGTDVYNADTDGDGYVDGEEIVSVTNPTDHDDNRGTLPNQNVTKTLTERLIGGVYAGDLISQKGQNEKYKDNISLMTLAAIDEAGQALAPAFINDSLLIGDDSKESQEQYLKDVAALLDGQFLDAFITQSDSLNKAVNFLLVGQNDKAFSVFDQHAIYFTTAYTKLLAVSAPPRWLPLHRQLLVTFQKIATDYISLTKIYDDPIVAMAALNDLAANFSLLQFSTIEELKRIVAEEQLSLPNSQLFSILGLLGNSQKILSQ